MNRISKPSKNFDDRPPGDRVRFLVLHSTECDLKMSLDILTDDTSDTPVSAHYVVAKNGDVYELVSEDKRAWHAGNSHWVGIERLNATSVGIEVVNTQGTPFEGAQMQSVFQLSREIITRHRIKPNHIVAHSDIALGRKVDPGPLFDWKWLAERGVGLYPQLSSAKNRGALSPQSSIEDIQKVLQFMGYKVSPTGSYDAVTRHALKAFQMRFRPSQVDGEADAETLNLLSAYREILKQLPQQTKG